jgi:TRAP-type C4-dicarboxylate transport system substrate-binding protein
MDPGRNEALMTGKRLIAGLGLALLAGTQTYAGDALHLSVASGLPANHVALKIFREKFQSEIEQRVAAQEHGQIVWDETHAGKLSHYGGVLEAVEDDLAMFAVVSVNHEPRRLPLQNLTFHAPFTTESCSVVANAYHGIRQDVKGMTEPFTAARQTYLAAMASDGYNFISTRKIRNAADLRGIRIGVLDHIDGWLDGVEAIPVRLLPDLLAPRIEDDVLAGALLPNTEMRRLALKQHADHYTRTGFGAQVPFVISVNTKVFADLPGPVREIVLATAADFVPAAAGAYCAAGADALETLKKQGIETAKLLKSRRLQWADMLSPLAQANDQAGHPGSAAVAAYMGHLVAAKVKVTRDWSLPAPNGALKKMSPPASEVSQVPAK